MASTLEILLRRLRDGQAQPGDLAAARDLAVQDDRLPAELRDLVLRDAAEAASDAAGLLAVLGSDDLGSMIAEAIGAEVRTVEVHAADPVSAEALARQAASEAWARVARALREALASRAAGVEVTEAVLTELAVPPFALGEPLREAVRAEAGTVSVVAAVLGELELAGTSLPVAEAVRAEAGTVSVVAAVLREVELAGASLPVAEAVHAEAGTVRVVAPVMARLAVGERPSSLADPRQSGAELLPAANNARLWAGVGLLIAAAVLALVIGLNRLGPGTGTLHFAKADEVVVEELSLGEGMEASETWAEDGTMILWLTEEE